MVFAFASDRLKHDDRTAWSDIHLPTTRRRIMSMGNRAIWAGLWVLGIPLPILLILYLLTGGGCNAN